MSVLSRYLNRMFFARFVVTAFGVLGFAAVIDLLDVGDQLVKSPEGALLAGLRYFTLRLPIMFSELMPIAALIAALLTVGDLMRHRELVVAWSSGLHPGRILGLLFPAFLILVAGKFAIDDLALPYTATQLRLWGIGEYRHHAGDGQAGDFYWLRSGPDIVRISANGAAAGQILDVTIFRRGADGILTERIVAASAKPQPDGWLLEQVTRSVLADRRVETLPTLRWTGDIDLQRIRLMARPPRELSLGQLWQIIAAGGYGMRAPEPYVTWLHQRIAGSLTPALLMYLAFALVRRFSRTSSMAPVYLRAVTIGFSLIIMSGVANALGEVGFVPPPLAAWAPTVLLATLILVLGVGLGRLARPAPAAVT